MAKLLRLPLYSALALLIYTPFHVFLSQWLSTATGGLDEWKAGKDVFLLVALLFTVVLLAWTRKFKDKYFWIFVGGSLAYFVIHLLVWAANPGIENDAALLATAYNCRILGYAILGWGAILLFPDKLPLKKIFTLTVAVSTVVAFLGVVQYALPDNFMSHFGYSLERGVKPAFFIDDKSDLPRIMSTLRDPNSLGAFLILPITLLATAWIKRPTQRILLSGLILLHAWALFLTFSRSAWLGTVLSLAIIFFWSYKDQTLNFAKKYKFSLILASAAVLFGFWALRDQYFVQNVIFHADEATVLEDPNEKRVSITEDVTEEVISDPLGHGPGTAGLVSIQTENVVLTENYFLQIAYEVGLQGLAVLLALMFFVSRILFARKNTYAKILLASFAGITLTALLLHTWTNEAVATQWWLLAGVVIAGSSVFSVAASAPKARRRRA